MSEALDLMPQLTPEQRQRLRERWVTSVRELVALSLAPSGRDGLKQLLRVDDSALEGLLQEAKALLPPDVLRTLAEPQPGQKLGLVIPREVMKRFGLREKDVKP